MTGDATGDYLEMADARDETASTPSQEAAFEWISERNAAPGIASSGLTPDWRYAHREPAPAGACPTRADAAC